MTLVENQAPDSAPLPEFTVEEVQALAEQVKQHGLLGTDLGSLLLARKFANEVNGGNVQGAYACLLDQLRSGSAIDMALDAQERQHGTGKLLEFRMLDPAKKSGATIRYWRTGSDRCVIRDELRQHYGRRNLYVGVNPRKADKCRVASTADDVECIRYLVTDHDFKNAPPNDPMWEQARTCLRAAGPAMEVHTGNGFQSWNRVADVTDPAEQADVVRCHGAVLRAIGSDAVADSPRIMRLPWTINIPTRAKRAGGARLVLATVVDGPHRAGPVRPWREVLADIATNFGLDLDALVSAGPVRTGRTGPGTGPGNGLPPEMLQAPSIELLQDVLAAIPNDDTVTREEQVRMAFAVRRAAHGTDFEAEAREAFLEWSARYPSADPDHDAKLFDGVRL